MTKVSIIGANSLIARNIITQCKKYEIEEIKLYDIHPVHADGAENYIQANILSMESLANVDFYCDILFVFAGKTGTWQGFDEYNSYIDINEKGLLNILTAYRIKKSKAKIIFPSTRLVYKGQKDASLAEDAPKEFKTLYAINKYCCEQYLKMFNNVYDVQYCIFRLCVPYGTFIPQASSYGTAEMFLSKAKNGEPIKLYGDGSVRRTLIHMGDLCDALIQGSLSTRCLNDVYNIGGGDDASLFDMAKLLSSFYNVEVQFVPWPDEAFKIESGDTVFDSKKFDNAIGFIYKKTFAEWIKENDEIK